MKIKKSTVKSMSYHMTAIQIQAIYVQAMLLEPDTAVDVDKAMEQIKHHAKLVADVLDCMLAVQ